MKTSRLFDLVKQLNNLDNSFAGENNYSSMIVNGISVNLENLDQEVKEYIDKEFTKILEEAKNKIGLKIKEEINEQL